MGTTGGWKPQSHHGRVVTTDGNHGRMETTKGQQPQEGISLLTKNVLCLINKMFIPQIKILVTHSSTTKKNSSVTLWFPPFAVTMHGNHGRVETMESPWEGGNHAW